MMCFFCSVIFKLHSAEEKKPVKRSYQKIQEDEDDDDNDYRSHTSPRNADSSATQLVKMPTFNPDNVKMLVFLTGLLTDLLLLFPPLPFFPLSPVFKHTLAHVQTEELVKALQDLENAASGDAAVRQKIASLPQEVQDVSLLEKITGKAWTAQLSFGQNCW